MSNDERFLIAIAIMASVAYGCRAIGLIVGSNLGENPNLRRFLDILPACAMGAVLGPSLLTMTLVQTIAIVSCVSVYFVSSRFLSALICGTIVLACEKWLLALLS